YEVASHTARAGALRRARPVVLFAARAEPHGELRSEMNLSILYRGPLSSCNYACDYCPFAKHTETVDELAHDRACLERFVAWVGSRSRDSIGVLFTPWGEALVRKWYQTALAALTHMPHVTKAVIQTNLS